MQKLKEYVISYYPLAVSINVGCKNGDYYEIWSAMIYLGQGKTEEDAWKSAKRNLDYE